MDLFETLSEALRPQKVEPKKYYNVWVHVEEVSFDEDGNEQYRDMDEEFMPIKISKEETESNVRKTLDYLESTYSIVD